MVQKLAKLDYKTEDFERGRSPCESELAIFRPKGFVNACELGIPLSKACEVLLKKIEEVS